MLPIGDFIVLQAGQSAAKVLFYRESQYNDRVWGRFGFDVGHKTR